MNYIQLTNKLNHLITNKVDGYIFYTDKENRDPNHVMIFLRTESSKIEGDACLMSLYRMGEFDNEFTLYALPPEIRESIGEFLKQSPEKWFEDTNVEYDLDFGEKALEYTGYKKIKDHYRVVKSILNISEDDPRQDKLFDTYDDEEIANKVCEALNRRKPSNVLFKVEVSS